MSLLNITFFVHGMVYSVNNNCNLSFPFPNRKPLQNNLFILDDAKICHTVNHLKSWKWIIVFNSVVLLETKGEFLIYFATSTDRHQTRPPLAIHWDSRCFWGGGTWKKSLGALGWKPLHPTCRLRLTAFSQNISPSSERWLSISFWCSIQTMCNILTIMISRRRRFELSEQHFTFAHFQL